MKKHVIIATGAALLSTSAFATKARMNALGQDEARGSQYLNDTRNVFRNAAHVNNTNNYVVIEWGEADTTDADTKASPNAEGGMFRDAGAFSYGLYFNDYTYVQERDTAFDGVTPTNGLDLFFGGDAGIQWGARLNYSKFDNKEADTKGSAFGLGLGMIMGDISAYANLQLKDESEVDAENKWEADTTLNIGAAYKWNNWTFHADYFKEGADETLTGDKTEFSYSLITVGAAQVHEISSTAMVFTAVDYMTMSDEEKAGSNSEEEKTNALKLTIGFEADATSWLTLRGSIAQNVLIGSEETKASGAGTAVKKSTLRDSTTVGAGASLTFGKLMVDGTLSGATTGNLQFDDFMANVAVSYWF